MSNLCSQAVKYHLNALMARAPEKNTYRLKHNEGLTKYSDKLKSALQLQMDKIGNFMTDSATHSSASVEKSGFEEGWME